MPGVLTQLTIQMPYDQFRSESRHGFIESRENTSESGSLWIDIPPEKLEALWLPIQVLHLRGIYPHWSSKAYYGLVELRLLDTNAEPILTITEAHLLGILESSPQLRILHFSMELEQTFPKHASITPVYLGSLEVLDLSLMHPHHNGTILR